LFSQVARYLPQQQVLDLQQTLGFRGHTQVIANACASGANSIGHAADLIGSGAADCVLTGGFEALTELVFVGFDCLQATTTEKCRPFDLHRSGLMIGEAAAFLVLESREHAVQRGARVLCRLTGYGHTTDVFHLTQPQPEGAALVNVMAAASEQAGVTPGDIGYVNAHGTATRINDRTEVAALRDLFGAHLDRIAVSSTKSMIGHCMAAGGALELALTMRALREGMLPPTAGFHAADPATSTASPAPPAP
jgi:3-oxoacyl-[acyl-carrier-protein] synthase II